jgi:hypothetical protein
MSAGWWRAGWRPFRGEAATGRSHTTDKPRSVASWCIVGHAAGFAAPDDARFVMEHLHTPRE